MKFLSTKTKVTGIVAGALTLIALITLVMLSTLIPMSVDSRLIMSLIYSVALMLIMLIWKGILDIVVFKEYKCQCKHLCAEGVLNICLGALLAIVGVLYLTLRASSGEKILYFLASFIFAMGIWKVFELILSITHKHYDRVLDAITVALWLCLGALVVVAIFCYTAVLGWVIVALTWALLVLNVLSILISYVIKDPTYLETDTAVEIVTQEQEEKELKKEKERQLIKGKNAKDKLVKLKDLYEQNLITQADYDAKKKEILDSMVEE